MNKQFNDDEIIQLYQQNNEELPPKAIDEVILAKAEAAINPSKQSGTTNRSRWWQYSGIAAATLAIVVYAPWQYFTEPTLELAESVDVPALPQAKKALKSAPQVEAMEVLADEAPIETIAVTGSRYERALPDQSAQKTKMSPKPVLSQQKETPSLSEFDEVLVALEKQDKANAEKMLIKLLQAKPELHNEVPASLEVLYQTLLDSEKLIKPAH